MNRTIITLLLIFSSILLANGQKTELFTKYHSNYADRSYDIKIIYSDTNNYKIELYLMTYDNRYSKGGFILTNKTLPGFINALDTAETFYTKWVVPAKARKGSKKITRYFQEEKIQGFFDEKKKTRIDFPLKAKYRYRVLKKNNEIVYVLNITTGNLRSQHGNQYTVQSFSLFFLSEKEISEFRNLITPEKVKTFIKGKM